MYQAYPVNGVELLVSSMLLIVVRIFIYGSELRPLIAAMINNWDPKARLCVRLLSWQL